MLNWQTGRETSRAAMGSAMLLCLVVLQAGVIWMPAGAFASSPQAAATAEAQYDGRGEDANSHALQHALQALLKKAGEGWFLIIEDVASGKFVQYAWGVESGLVFDLPVQALDPDELDLASTLLAEFNIQLASWPIFDAQGEVLYQQTGFSKNLGRDVVAAVRLAEVVLYEIYQLNRAADLSITTDR